MPLQYLVKLEQEMESVLTAASGAWAFGVVAGGGRDPGKPWWPWCCGLGGIPGPGPGEWLGGWEGCGDGWLTGADEEFDGLPGPP